MTEAAFRAVDSRWRHSDHEGEFAAPADRLNSFSRTVPLFFDSTRPEGFSGLYDYDGREDKENGEEFELSASEFPPCCIFATPAGAVPFTSESVTDTPVISH